jgi:hypothetical protein
MASLDIAFAAASTGMSQAADAADRNIPGWTNMAFEFLVDFARSHDRFISEDVSDASKKTNFPQPHTDRAWGSVYRRAIKENIIIQDGIGRSRRRHASVCPYWKSLI